MTSFCNKNTAPAFCACKGCPVLCAAPIGSSCAKPCEQFSLPLQPQQQREDGSFSSWLHVCSSTALKGKQPSRMRSWSAACAASTWASGLNCCRRQPAPAMAAGTVQARYHSNEAEKRRVTTELLPWLLWESALVGHSRLLLLLWHQVGGTPWGTYKIVARRSRMSHCGHQHCQQEPPPLI